MGSHSLGQCLLIFLKDYMTVILNGVGVGRNDSHGQLYLQPEVL